jgi:RimJ/RimL family protein N-acetyltransferase
MKIIIETERLLLREFTLDDAQLLFDLNSDPEVIKYIHELAPTLESSQLALQNIILPQYKLYGHGRWAAYLKDTNEFIGWCGLKYVKEKDEIDLGYRFKKQFWNKGYATEAAKATVDYGMTVLKMNRIIAKAHIENIGSQKVIEKCGLAFLYEAFMDGCPVKYYELRSTK